MITTLRLLYSTAIFLSSVVSFAQTDTTSWFPDTIFECQADPSGLYRNSKILGNLDENRILISFYNYSDKVTELWVSGGTKEYTRLVCRTPGHLLLELRGKIGNRYALAFGPEIYLMDVEKNSLEEINLSIEPSGKVRFNNFEIVNDHIFFQYEGRMYCTDGTYEGTFEFVDDRTGRKAEYFVNFPETFWKTQERCMFFSSKQDLWVSDGKKEGTYILNFSLLRPFYDDLTASNHRILLINYKGNVYSTDGTEAGTYALGIETDIRNLSFNLKEMLFYNDELYWTNSETSSIYKFDNHLRIKVPVCESDSISLNGGFDLVNGQPYWCSDVHHYSSNSIKINLNTCERTSDHDGKEMAGKDFYVVQDADSLFVYANTPGKRKIPLPYLVKKSSDGSGIESTHGNVCYTAMVGEDANIIITYRPSQMWVVQPRKNSFRPLKWKANENRANSAAHHGCGEVVYFLHTYQDKEFISVIHL